MIPIRILKSPITSLFQERLKTKNREMAVSAFIENVLKHRSNQMSLRLDDSRSKLDGLKDIKKHVEQELKQSMNKRKAASDAMKTACQLSHLDQKKMDEKETRIFAKLNKVRRRIDSLSALF